ncbi:GNAT family N-acetyltransferase [Dysgonomonas sp. 25]|uniref:GNAT family N-acetyltransferase n=1 Tax=Dysgonomonas sp. 25 TaxID=2302933 RepID=UPI0013D818C8|nr:GNAT family N-acetyltransferase [Dysgonomonas sp. 25]NDV68489.1 GNAT family N-acetyltransferase [Dysgonomonas sp. 25]
MENLEIKLLDKTATPPYDLLTLADPSEEAVAYYLDRGYCYVGYLGQTAIGEYVLLPTRPFTIELVNLAVDEAYQNKGYGKKLIAHAIGIAKEKGFHVLEVGTGNAGIGQLALYQKCGFTITSVDIDFFRKHYSEPIYENGIECRHMVRLTMDL